MKKKSANRTRPEENLPKIQYQIENIDKLAKQCCTISQGLITTDFKYGTCMDVQEIKTKPHITQLKSYTYNLC